MSKARYFGYLPSTDITGGFRVFLSSGVHLYGAMCVWSMKKMVKSLNIAPSVESTFRTMM